MASLTVAVIVITVPTLPVVGEIDISSKSGPTISVAGTAVGVGIAVGVGAGVDVGVGTTVGVGTPVGVGAGVGVGVGTTVGVGVGSAALFVHEPQLLVSNPWSFD